MPQWVTSGYKAGDLAIFDFTAPVGDCNEHTGIIESAGGSTVVCIEGNTSDMVARKTRYLTNVLGAYRPDYTASMTAEKLLSIARGEIGYKETGDNCTKYGEAYGLNGYAWCVMFEWWCFKQAGMSSLFCGGSKVADCGTLRRYAEKGGTSSGSSSGSSSASGKKVCYCTPKVEIVQSTTSAGSGTVLALQLLLIGKGFSCGSAGADGKFGSGTKAAIIAAQKKLGLTADGSAGADTWAGLIAMEV